ncbi:MAG: FAD dependent oxidoreductase [Candidatus Aramenus sulfurataquae]|jgi:flavin-dependent dehydrogenase|uniref:FAD-dependent oxidoreductase n=2 Tax=Candidatus Aramenus sulfurataquae TaxID=1326980 RepID=W7KYL7_9CREN|nr:MAG: FAD dependent oxidoreductase [Candidatus Aramenus sulfurataquae]MCL7344160.1 NAD(P)/FAD-dependent oxidoreductase [Candidatus Aramenus sulfurataquae]
MQIAVVGGGPAGISLAYFLRGSKHEVTVYEGLSTFGVKPCAWGVLSDIDKVIDVPKESVISEIKGFRVYLDNKLLYEVEKKSKLGYIVDKPLFLKLLAEKVYVRLNAKVVTKDGKAFVNGEELKADKVIYANGHYSLPKEYTIPAIQYITDYNIDPEIVEMYFYSDLLGYGWVFPERGGAKIGIGGYADVNFLKERLKTILKGRVKGFQGARVNDYGVVEERLNGNYVGEALGTVYAVTGEGIRPSIISSKIMAKSILEGKDFRREFTSSQLYSSLKVHARVIAHAKKTNSVKGLERVLLKADPELVIKFAMGEFSKIDLLKLFGRMIF